MRDLIRWQRLDSCRVLTLNLFSLYRNLSYFVTVRWKSRPSTVGHQNHTVQSAISRNVHTPLIKGLLIMSLVSFRNLVGCRGSWHSREEFYYLICTRKSVTNILSCFYPTRKHFATKMPLYYDPVKEVTKAALNCQTTAPSTLKTLPSIKTADAQSSKTACGLVRNMLEKLDAHERILKTCRRSLRLKCHI